MQCSSPRFLFSLGLFAASAVAQTPVFFDTFENGAVTNGEVIAAFWTPSAPANTTVAETGGTLVITAGGPASPNGTLAPHLRSGNPSAQFNFFRGQLRFAATVGIAGTAPANQSLLRFALTGNNAANYSAEDALAVRISADNRVSLSLKQDRAAISPEGVTLLINAANVGSTITGFELTLDATNYALVVTHTGGAGSTAFNGAHGLIAAQWGVDGASAFQFEVVRATGAGAGAGLDSVGTVDNFTVARLAPAPPLVGDTFGNGVLADSDDTMGFWTTMLPQTSAVAENGKLVLTASSASTGNIRASHASALGSNVNFFSGQLKIGAELAVSGDTAGAWMSRGQLVLASTATNGFAAPDTLMVGFRAQNNIAFNRKLDAPNVEPDANNTASVTELLGTTAGGNEVVGVSGNDLLNGFELTLNASRYRLKGFNGGKGSGIIRFTGAHGIPQAQWGANGDSALLLEAFRTSGAAGTTTTSVWDNVTVEADATKMLAEPYWDFLATYDETGAHSYTIWVPSTEPIIRGVIFIGPGTGEDFRYFVHDPVAQEAARAIGFALIGYQNAGNMRLWSNTAATIQPAVQAVLDAAAAACGRPEIANAPLCITGCSAGAFDSSYLARNWPERVIAFVCHRGNDFSNPVLAPAAKKVPGLMVGGSIDGNGLTEPFYMQTRFVSWRSQGAQVAYAVDWGVGHTPRGNQGWEGTFTWFVEVANLRYPRPATPSLAAGAGPPTLIELADESGWLGDRTEYSAAYTPSVTSPFTAIAPFASYGGVVTNASWLPNETCARMYRALTSTDRASRTVVPLQCPLRITSPKQYADPVTAGLPMTIDLDPRDFDNTNTLVSVEFHDGATLLGTDTTGPGWSQTFAPTEPGLHTLTLVATDTLGAQRAAMRTLCVVPADFPPMGVAQAHTFGGHTNVSGTVTALDPEDDGSAVTFTLATGPLHGQLNFDAATGAFTYQPDAGFVGTDAFTFAAISAGVTGPVSIVSFDVTPATPAGILEFADTALKVDKTAGLATLTVNRSAAAAGAVSAGYATSDSSAAAGTHYTATNGTLNWADGDLTPKTFSVPILNTASPQLPRQFKVALGDPTGGVVLGDRVSAAVLIEDPTASLGAPWGQAVLGTLTDSSPAVSAEGTLGDATIGGGGVFNGATSDRGRFIYQSRTGDGMLRMFVPTPTPAQAAGRFALMVRATLVSNSMMVAAVTSGDATNYGAKHVYRTAASAAASATPATHNDQSTPRWLSLTRAGNNFTTQSSADGTNWTLLGSVTLAAMPATANWGIFHCSADLAPTTDLGDYQLATFEGVSFGAPPIPATPSGLGIVSFAGLDQVIFYWTADSFASGFRIERRTETGDFVPLGSVSNETFYNDYAIAADTGYAYRVQAYNSSGDSPWSVETRATTPPSDPQLPTRPSFLTATPGAGSNLDLQWEDNSDDEIGFPLERRAANGIFAPLQTLASNTTSFADGTTLPGLLYEYRLRATNVAGNSAWTPIASATAPGTATGYQNWLFANGLPMDASGSGSATATPSSDGLPNLVKYALGLDATVNGNSGRLSYGTATDGGNDYLTLTYIRPDPVPADITYSVEASPDLTPASWTSTGLVEISNTVNAGLRTLTFRDSVPIAGANRRFMRLKVTQP